jgi:hypothetical protein
MAAEQGVHNERQRDAEICWAGLHWGDTTGETRKNVTLGTGFFSLIGGIVVIS